MQRQRHQVDYVLFFTVIILTAVGVLTIFSASTVIAIQHGMPPAYYANRQLLFGIVGTGFMIGLSFVPAQTWYRMAPLLAGISLILLVLVLIPHVGQSLAGGRRWLGAGSLRLQPSEMAIIAVLLYLSFFFTKKVTLLHSFKKGMLPAVIVTGLAFLLIIFEPDMGTAMTLLASCMVLLFASGARMKPLLLLMGALAPIIVGFGFLESYRSARIQAWLDPFHSANAYQLLQGFTAMAAGGWFGRGFDMSIQKMGYLPVPQIDFIFPVFVEEWGFLGAIALIATFAVLIWRGFHTARRAPDRFSSLLALGLTGMITFKTIINLGAVTGLLPVTGIPLPFISYGGTSLLMNLSAMGILLSISRTTLLEEPEEDQLADVIPVEDAKQRRQQRPPAAARAPVPAFGRSQTAYARSAEVRPLPRRGRTNSAPSSWRSQKHPVQPQRTSIAPAKSWRETNQSLPPGGGLDRGKPRRKPKFRKD
ncbi:hypothetical protein GCM10025857_08070 [Alicyclobacillus contaminans]|uniref:FtsW/RodA/SpoVE family cell cycle protein n=1 Tax=Alicyclobacillus contaminans TaxID=392016 RepID=UPI00146FA2B0|nr:FtsW/RodA/SpoVE family cell cycle protein [Alicyclobacillus contaminans]GMA49450.1 hypothetical protein GCM10025857_08070 [Alicyclobacillus contaminans]